MVAWPGSSDQSYIAFDVNSFWISCTTVAALAAPSFRLRQTRTIVRAHARVVRNSIRCCCSVYGLLYVTSRTDYSIYLIDKIYYL
jgi:hypothetical protein